VIALDTNVLVYAVGSPHPLAEPCRALVEAIRDRRLEATTTSAVIQEFAHVAGRRQSRRTAVGLAIDYADLLAPLLPVSEAHLRRSLRIYRDYPGLEAFDALLAATALEEGLEAILSTDARLRTVADLVVIVPGTDRFAELLG
jgi:predicted nucleic acid-binding protein